MANTSGAALGTRPQPTLVPITYKKLQKTRLKIKSVLVFVWLSLPASCADPKYSFFFQFPSQLGAKLYVISQMTITIFGVLRRHCIPLATNQHTETGVMSSNKNSNKTSTNSKVGHPQLA